MDYPERLHFPSSPHPFPLPFGEREVLFLIINYPLKSRKNLFYESRVTDERDGLRFRDIQIAANLAGKEIVDFTMSRH